MIKSNRFLIIASTVGIIFIIGLMILYRQIVISSLVDHETRSNVAITEIMSNVFRSGYRDLIDIDSAKINELGGKHPVILQLDAEVKRLMRGSKLIKVKIYNLDGLTIFSTDPSQINQDKRYLRLLESEICLCRRLNLEIHKLCCRLNPKILRPKNQR